MLLDLLLREPWAGIVLWVCLYSADYALTIVAARLYESGAKKHVVFAGGMELTPVFRKDVAALHWVSRPFVLRLLLSVPLLWIAWRSSQMPGGIPYLFEALLGALVLRQVPVLLRHLNNLCVFRLLGRSGGVSGRVVYSRWFSLRVSAVAFGGFALVFLLIFVLVGRWFFLAGAASTFTEAARHWHLSRRENPLVDPLLVETPSTRDATEKAGPGT